MKKKIFEICKFSAVFAAFCMTGDVFANQAQSARTASNVVSSARYSSAEGKRATANAGSSVVARSSAGRETATRVATRKSAKIVNRADTPNVSRTASVSRSAVNSRQGNVVETRGNVSSARSASALSGTARSAGTTRGDNWLSRSAAQAVGASHATRARATAIFDDVTKMGTGYAACRDAYSTCMDQLCGKANETYRRCFCSSKFADFRDTEYALEDAKTLLMQFEDNSLNAIDKTKEEVDAMYSPTIGEKAIKKDTSAAQKTLDEISELLTGKRKKASTVTTTTSTSTGLISLDLNTDVGDIWGENSTFSSSSSIFGGTSSSSDVDLSQLEGLELYNKANSQCLTIVANSCENSAALNMAKSSYNILISQDCNAYEKKIETQRDAVKNTVRQAEKILRDARLEDYRNHNSQDVNDCLDKVRTAIQQDSACGANYYRCLDYTGKYIDSTGNPIYKPWLFELEYLIDLTNTNSSGTRDFMTFLDERKMFATQALDTCRSLQDTVWTEFKRVALIEIAQAQAAKVEEVRNSCVQTMKDCYDSQSGQLKELGTESSAVATGALAAYVTKSMCVEKVVACAALYSSNSGEGCSADDMFDSAGHLKTDDDGKLKRCGLTSLLSFVDRVDAIRVNEGCATALDDYITKLCTPDTTSASNAEYPLLCVGKKLGDETTDAPDATFNASIASNLKAYALANCANPEVTKSGDDSKDYNNTNIITQEVRREVGRVLDEVSTEMDMQLTDTCSTAGGYWVSQRFGSDGEKLTGSNGTQLLSFYTQMSAGNTENEKLNSWGKCYENTVKLQCESFNEVGTDKEAIATYDAAKDECVFVESWYESKCAEIGGYYNNSTCYIKE